jgi:inner membrane protein
VGADANLNRRGAQLIGRQVQLAQAIEHGEGRVRVGDGEWIALGPDLPAGNWVRITGAEGTALRVEPLDQPDAAPALPDQA